MLEERARGPWHDPEFAVVSKHDFSPARGSYLERSHHVFLHSGKAARPNGWLTDGDFSEITNARVLKNR